jgi:hypothetical protein
MPSNRDAQAHWVSELAGGRPASETARTRVSQSVGARLEPTADAERDRDEVDDNILRPIRIPLIESLLFVEKICDVAGERDRRPPSIGQPKIHGIPIVAV